MGTCLCLWNKLKLSSVLKMLLFLNYNQVTQYNLWLLILHISRKLMLIWKILVSTLVSELQLLTFSDVSLNLLSHFVEQSTLKKENSLCVTQLSQFSYPFGTSMTDNDLQKFLSLMICAKTVKKQNVHGITSGLNPLSCCASSTFC